jgi:hypothetical protein
MELRARTQPLPRRAVTMTALALLVASAFAGAVASPADAKKKPKAPVITKVSPLDVAVGEVLTIKGRNFQRGRKKNTVVFKRPGARAVFVKADIGTAKLLKVTLPDTLQKVFVTKNNVPVSTRFQLRVLTTRLGKKYTSRKNSPVVSAPRPPKPPQSAADGDCNGDGIKNSATTDDDGDLLPDTLEVSINTDSCKADTDGDGVNDGYEYQSALDLNDDEFQQPNGNLFYPAKLPYPNPLFAGDANTDFDGDMLTLSEEQALWRYTVNVSHTDAYTLTPLSYSDGEQYSRSTRIASGPDAGRRQPILTPATDDKRPAFVDWANQAGYRYVRIRTPFGSPGLAWTQYSLFDPNKDGVDEIADTDRSHDGYLSDDERDEDADGLSNWDELHGHNTSGFWNTCYTNETPFHIPYGGTSAVDADSDGDGVRDGADDQDHDDYPNLWELSRIVASGVNQSSGFECKLAPAPGPARTMSQYGWMQPYNPCLPDLYSRTCPIGGTEETGTPFDGVTTWYALN